jgi:hypothetical protein
MASIDPIACTVYATSPAMRKLDIAVPLPPISSIMRKLTMQYEGIPR